LYSRSAAVASYGQAKGGRVSSFRPARILGRALDRSGPACTCAGLNPLYHLSSQPIRNPPGSHVLPNVSVALVKWRQSYVRFIEQRRRRAGKIPSLGPQFFSFYKYPLCEDASTISSEHPGNMNPYCHVSRKRWVFINSWRLAVICGAFNYCIVGRLTLAGILNLNPYERI
jgi:hypothetical protein